MPPNPSERLSDPVVLLFETSPYGTLDAIVQHDGKAVFFYLNEGQNAAQNQDRQPTESNQKFGTRACWVRNLDIGPYVLNEEEMRRGISPMLPRTHCVDTNPGSIPVAENLEIVWLEEGNGAALIENLPDSPEPKTLAIIPPWSGLEGFHGYASECAMESPLCWPMPDNPRLQQRIESAKEFWNQFEPENLGPEFDNQTYSDAPFVGLQQELLKCYDDHFLNEPNQSAAVDKKYFAIDGGKFPPRGMIQYLTDDSLVLLTVGMSLCPQPAVEIFSDTPKEQRRIELGIRIDGKKQIQFARENVGAQLSGLAAYPWQNFTWLGAGHTCDFSDVIPGYTGAILTVDDQPKLPRFREDPVTLLWLVPKSEAELAALQN